MIGIAYLDDDNTQDGAIWNTRPWEHNDYYFGAVDYTGVADGKWYHVVTPTALVSACEGMQATTILLLAQGAGTGAEMANFKNFCVKNANGEIVTEIKNAGDYTAEIKVTLANGLSENNYDIPEIGEIAITVAKAQITITVKPIEREYNSNDLFAPVHRESTIEDVKALLK